MKHLNSVVGFEYVKPIFETGQGSSAIICGSFFKIEDCVEKDHGIWEGTLVSYLNGLDGFVKQTERITFTPPKLDPHTFIQNNRCSHDDMRAYTVSFDEHVSHCPDCEKKMRTSSGAVLLGPYGMA